MLYPGIIPPSLRLLPLDAIAIAAEARLEDSFDLPIPRLPPPPDEPITDEEIPLAKGFPLPLIPDILPVF